MDDRSVVNCYGNKVTLTIDIEDDKLKTWIHDKSGWIFDTTNVVVALSILRDKKISDLDTMKKDDTKIIDILDNELAYDKELVLNSLNDDGDLNWVHWLSGGNAYWMQGYDRDYIYDDIKDMYLTDSLTDEDEDEDGNYTEVFYNKMDKMYDDIIEKYDVDKIQEQIKKDHESDLLYAIDDSLTWNELSNKIKDLESLIQTFLFEYLTNFIYSCNVL